MDLLFSSPSKRVAQGYVFRLGGVGGGGSAVVARREAGVMHMLRTWGTFRPMLMSFLTNLSACARCGGRIVEDKGTQRFVTYGRQGAEVSSSPLSCSATDVFLDAHARAGRRYGGEAAGVRGAGLHAHEQAKPLPSTLNPIPGTLKPEP